MFRTIALLLPLLALGAAPRAEFRLQDRLPDSTRLFAETPSAAAFRAAFQKTPLAKFFEDEEVRAFGHEAFQAALKNFETFAKDFEKELGLPLDKAWELPTGQIALALPTIVPGDGPPRPDAVFSLDCAGKRDSLLKLLGYVRKSYEQNSGKKAESWKAGAEEVLSGELAAGIRWHLAVLGDTLIAATEKGTMEQVLGGAPARALSASGPFKKAVEKSGAKEAFFFADVAAIVRDAKARLGASEKRFVAALGLEGFSWAAGGLAFGDGSVREQLFLATEGPKKGLARFMSLKGEAEGFEAAPRNALQFASFSIDTAELYDTFLEAIKDADEGQHQRTLDAIDDFEKAAGISLRNDLFPAFGPRVTSTSVLPPDGILPDGVTTFEIRDAAAFDKCLGAILRSVPAELAQLDFKGRKIQYFAFSHPGGGFEPARVFLSSIYFLREGNRLTVSSAMGGAGGPSALKRHILRMDQPRLSTHPAVQQWLGGKTGGASLVAYLNLEQLFTVIYNTAAPIATFFRDSFRFEGAGVDLFKLPLGETVGKYMGQVVYRVSVEPDGLRAEGISASGTTLMAAVYLGTAGMVLVPAIQRATEEASLAQCKSQAGTVYFALVNYHTEKNAYPEKTGAEFFAQLQELGYLQQVPFCPCGQGGIYRGPAKNVNEMADEDVIFCDQPGNHPNGSITIVRRNGSMETLDARHPDYAKSLQTTKGD